MIFGVGLGARNLCFRTPTTHDKKTQNKKIQTLKSSETVRNWSTFGTPNSKKSLFFSRFSNSKFKKIVTFLTFFLRGRPSPNPCQIRKSQTLETEPGDLRNCPQPLTSWGNVLNQRQGCMFATKPGQGRVGHRRGHEAHLEKRDLSPGQRR